MLAELPSARFGHRPHVGLRPELQTAGRTRLDARRLEPLADPIRAERALVDLLGRRLNFGMSNGQPDMQYRSRCSSPAGSRRCRSCTGRWRRRPGQARRHRDPRSACTGPCASATSTCRRRAVFVELDQVPVVPCRRRHRLVRVVERRLAERHVVPLDTCDLARFAPDARRHVDVLADLFLALHSAARGAAGDLTGASGLICSVPSALLPSRSG